MTGIAQTKGRIKNLAAPKGADPRAIMRMYMMERFLERVALSKYKDNFVIKGGLLITAMVGVAMRSTMDIDTSMKDAELSFSNARKIVEAVISVEIDDGIVFEYIVLDY